MATPTHEQNGQRCGSVYGVTVEIGVAVDRLNRLDEEPFSRLVEPAHPDHQGLEVHEEHPGGLLQIPPTSRAELQDAHALERGVMGATPGPGSLPPSVLEGELFTEQGDLGVGLLEARAKRPSAPGRPRG